MGQSYRIRTELGINKTINIQLDQEFEFLEILSIKLQQEDVYTKSCAEYGVVVGRVTANNGFGLPNARVSIFIPIESIDESNPLISSIYPYKSPNDRNEDGYRYNLLPYQKSYSTHAATGTLPTRLDSLTGNTAIEIYDKYYKFTSKTNESGDYMIMGVPQGQHTLVMDVDLSDIGEFSLTPQDLIRMGLASEAQVAGNRFRTSTDLNSLPQIINIVKDLEVSPLWGDPELCDIAINRVDFDLRDDANIDIQPTATFMGSIFSSPDKMRVRKNSKPKDNLGNLCDLVAGPGQILAIRQTVNQDEDGNPVLEQYQLEQSGNIIDGSGAWLTELPMNLDYFITNEFGDKVLSNDPTVGIPTKAKYRFKVKWQQPPTLTEQTRRPYFLVPNVKEYGWRNSIDPIVRPLTDSNRKKLSSSYYFGLAWSGYTDGFSKTVGNEYYDRIDDIVNGGDTFYEFGFNRVYTVSQLIDEYKKGGRSRFIGIKEIDSDDCESTINKFPVNEGFRNFDLLYFLFSFIFQIIQLIGIPFIINIRIVLFIYAVIVWVLCQICQFYLPWPFSTYPFAFICRSWFKIDCEKGLDTTLPLTMLTYPECETCDCKAVITQSALPGGPTKQSTEPTGSLSFLSYPLKYNLAFQYLYKDAPVSANDIDVYSEISSIAVAGDASLTFISDPSRYKLPVSNIVSLPSTGAGRSSSSKSLPLGERINLFNQRDNFFSGLNKIKVSFAVDNNIGKFHYDNTITVLANPNGLNGQPFVSGDLLCFVNPSYSTDKNYLYSAATIDGNINGISGTSYNSVAATTVSVSNATSQYANSTPIIYTLPSGSTITNYRFAADIEYFQVLTAITISDATTLWNTSLPQTFPNVLNSPTTYDIWSQPVAGGNSTWLSATTINPLEYYDNYVDQVILILQRGVDPYSPKYTNQYGIGKILGFATEDAVTIKTEARLNIPIQRLTGVLPGQTPISVQNFTSQDDIYYQSYFFKPGIVGSTTYGYQYSAFTTNNLGYYGSFDASNAASNPWCTITPTTPNKCVTITSNGLYSSSINSSKYDLTEDLSSMAEMVMSPYVANVATTGLWPNGVPGPRYYYSKAFGPTLSFSISDSIKNVMRTDRLPTSDRLDGGSWTINTSILQQNLQFAIYSVNEQGISLSTGYGSGASQVSPDIGGLPNSTKVLSSFDCAGMVPLTCYQGFGSNFSIKTPCDNPLNAGYNFVKNGCYVLFNDPINILGVVNDLAIWSEWGFRFRFMYALCRGVLSQTFTNNWINGSLYMFPIQVDVYYDSQNKPEDPEIPYEMIYFDKSTTNFYFRSSPYDDISNVFVGRTTDTTATNNRNLMFPTTIINLGYKDVFYSELTFDPSTKAYIMSNLNPTSYGDTSDLTNLFVVSRLVDSSFLGNLLSWVNDSIGILFSRPNNLGYPFQIFDSKQRVDGDFVQLCSINSEIGNVNFSPEYYSDTAVNSPTNVLGSASNPVMAVWFSSTTEDLQTKDYLTPGRINFRTTNNTANYPYPYGIKSQIVPHYQWQLRNNSNNLIFGSQINNWATTEGDIVQNKPYQLLDRISLANPNYFRPTTSSITDLNARGYIFSVDANGSYTANNATNATGDKFIVGAPFHFYFGTIKGETALDLFKRKYSVIE